VARPTKKPLRASNEVARAKNRGMAARNSAARAKSPGSGGPRVLPGKSEVRLAPNNPAGTKGIGRQVPDQTLAAMLKDPIQARRLTRKTKGR
jgi:hypothetical protein